MFQAVLQELAAKSDARWAMIVGTDGVLLETNEPSFRAQAEMLAAEFAVFYRAAGKVAGNTELGGFLSSLLVTDQGKVLLQVLAADYFLIMLLPPESHAGKAFFELSRIGKSLEQELSV